MKKVLVIGGGGREHALAWKLASDSSPPELFCAPGNAGTAGLGTNLDIGAEDISRITEWSKRSRPDLVVAGPEAPLCAGLADSLQAEGITVFGPGRDAARLEGSKTFAKQVMNSAGVPTAEAREFSDAGQAAEYAGSLGWRAVVKADGLAAGKGVSVCASEKDVRAALEECLVADRFGDAGRQVLIEECLEGEEASILALVDGEHIVMLASSQDHKRVFNNDEGPNTGGMGAYSPAPVITENLWPVIRERVFEPTLAELRKRKVVYRGILYAGLMVSETGPKVLEFNCRFGDPETQAVLPRIEGDLLPALEACARGELSRDMLSWKEDHCVCVVMASGGYPGGYEKGKVIHGLGGSGDVLVFHAGTEKNENAAVITSGGRVLGVTALGRDLPQAVDRAYKAITGISFDQAQYRTDIGSRALNR
ncbi:MAG: phosphoribosylamine--glycine ligase [Kiritimatiellia bacterium]